MTNCTTTFSGCRRYEALGAGDRSREVASLDIDARESGEGIDILGMERGCAFTCSHGVVQHGRVAIPEMTFDVVPPCKG